MRADSDHIAGSGAAVRAPGGRAADGRARAQGLMPC